MELYGSRNERNKLLPIDMSDSKMQLHGLQDEKEAMQAHLLHRNASGPKRLNPGLLQQQHNPLQNRLQSIRHPTLNPSKESSLGNELQRRPQINRSQRR